MSLVRELAGAGIAAVLLISACARAASPSLVGGTQPTDAAEASIAAGPTDAPDQSSTTLPPPTARESTPPTAGPSPSQISTPIPDSSPTRPAAVQLGPEVLKPTDGPPKWLVPQGSPDARAESDGVVMELWVPHRQIDIGEWVTVHVRVTNEGSRSIYADCIPIRTVIDATSLFDPGETWTGTAALFKDKLLSENGLTRSTFGYRTGEGLDCPGGDIGQTDTLRPGESFEIDLFDLPRYWLDNQAFPAGTVPVRSVLHFAFNSNELNHALSVEHSVRVDGRPLPGVSPAQLADAAIRTDGFLDWVESRDPTRWANTQISGPGESKRIDWRFFGFEGPAPNGTITMGLFAEGPATFLGEVLLDPWTGQSFGFEAR